MSPGQILRPLQKFSAYASASFGRTHHHMVDIRLPRFGRMQPVHGLHWVERDCHVAQRTSVASIDSDSPAGQPCGILLHVFDDATSTGVLGSAHRQQCFAPARHSRTSMGGTKVIAVSSSISGCTVTGAVDFCSCPYRLSHTARNFTPPLLLLSPLLTNFYDMFVVQTSR